MEKEIVHLRLPEGVTVSDGYHTFDELYAHRVALWIALCRCIAKDASRQFTIVWRLRLHSDGSGIPDWFVLGITMADGRQLTYHLPARMWDSTGFANTLERAIQFDGHTSDDVLNRLGDL